MEIAGPDTRVPYGEALRALGWRLDAWAWREIRLDARDPALALAGRPRGRQPARVARRVLVPADVPALLAEGRRRRGAALLVPAPPPRPGTLAYREALRLIGQGLDRRRARLVRVIEHADGLIVQSVSPGAGLTTALVPWPILAARHQRGIRQRRP